jgi:hypothetical protein
MFLPFVGADALFDYLPKQGQRDSNNFSCQIKKHIPNLGLAKSRLFLLRSGKKQCRRTAEPMYFVWKENKCRMTGAKASAWGGDSRDVAR